MKNRYSQCVSSRTANNIRTKYSDGLRALKAFSSWTKRSAYKDYRLKRRDDQNYKLQGLAQPYKGTANASRTELLNNIRTSVPAGLNNIRTRYRDGLRALKAFSSWTNRTAYKDYRLKRRDDQNYKLQGLALTLTQPYG
ncbi:hypothetical protein E4U38_007399 [Claviceps purpurea]|nr:hypothetical protein E4U38_007399 [Claviceps purpurea]